MTNLHDYLSWRGDLLTADVPLNDVDHLILSELSYVNFGDVVPEWRQGKSVTIAEAADRLLAFDPQEKKLDQTFYLWKDLRQLLSGLRASPRFAMMEISRPARVVDDETQFAAFCIRVAEDRYVIPFQGTDSSVIGWEEDLMLALDEAVPAQNAALEYLNAAAAELKGQFILSGHSKGGNLAVYAAAHADASVRRRVDKIYSFDGPGFTSNTLSLEGYRDIERKIVHIIPEYSLVGLLLTHTVNSVVIKSNSIGLLQHNGFTWQVKGGRFVQAKGLNEGSRKVGEIISNWLDQLDQEQRREFVTLLCKSLKRLNVERLEDIRLPALIRIPNVIRVMATIGLESKKEVIKALRQAIQGGRGNDETQE